MVKLLLPLLLLTPPVQAADISNYSCTEVFDIMMEHVIEGDLEYKEARNIYERCLAIE